MKKYMLSKNGSEMGPFSLSEVLSLITKREVELFDYIFDEAAQDWILLTEHADVTTGLKANKPKSQPKIVQAPTADATPASKKAAPVQNGVHEVEWFVMKGESQFGPFQMKDLIQLMQEKSLYEFDFVWNASMADWKRLAEIPEFSKEKIKNLVAQSGTKEAFFKRSHARQPFESKVIVHNGKDYWVACGKEISDGGMGIFVKDAMIVPGQILHFHVKEQNGQPAFNVTGEVVSKQYMDKTRHQKIEYGVKFLREEKSNELKRAG